MSPRIMAPRIMAHRGARNLWAENSATGFRNVAPLGFDAVEFDVHLTDAGELAVIHDPTLDRTTDAAGEVRALTPEARRGLRLRGPDGATIPEGIPTLDEVLDILTAADPVPELYVELKADARGRPYPGMIEAIAATLDRRGLAGLAGRAVLHSFDIDTVRAIRDRAPGFRRLISVNRDWADRQGGIAAFLQSVRGLVDVVGIHHALYEAAFDTIADLWPLEATSVWTINDPDLIRRWTGRGPGWLVSDDPVLLRRLVAEHSTQPERT